MFMDIRWEEGLLRHSHSIHRSGRISIGTLVFSIRSIRSRKERSRRALTLIGRPTHSFLVANNGCDEVDCILVVANNEDYKGIVEETAA